MTNKEIKYLEGTIEDLKERQKYFVPDWLTKINKLKSLEKFMSINFSEIADQEQVLRIAENLQQELKGGGVHLRKDKLVYFDRKEIFPIK